MNLHRWLTALLVLLALAGCASAATGQGQAPVPSYPRDNGPDMRRMMLPGERSDLASILRFSSDDAIEGRPARHTALRGVSQ
jgi:hypothetical protein